MVETHVCKDDLRILGERICEALRIPAGHVTRIELVLDAKNQGIPVVTVERAVIDAHALGALRSVFEQYRLVPATAAAALSEAEGLPQFPIPGL